jgi:hypothetical protein
VGNKVQLVNPVSSDDDIENPWIDRGPRINMRGMPPPSDVDKQIFFGTFTGEECECVGCQNDRLSAAILITRRAAKQVRTMRKKVEIKSEVISERKVK